MTTKPLPYAALHQIWTEIPAAERMQRFRSLPLAEAQAFFRELSTWHQYEIVSSLPEGEQTVWVRLLDPDDAADLVQEAPEEDKQRLLNLLDDNTRSEVQGLLKYAEDVAGGLMSPRFARLRPDLTVSDALIYLRRQALETTETVYALYVLDSEQHLLGVTSLRRLFTAPPQELITNVMRTNVVAVTEDVDQEQLSRLFAESDLIAIPVVDTENRMKGIVTIDDIVDVVEEEATEDIQKLGGSAVLGAPYLELSMGTMIKKRAGWLVILFLSELLTTNAMGYFQDEIARAAVLALFVPLVISSGGNAGSQASTIVIRAMALGEVQLRDWWRVFQREIVIGAGLGAILGVLGLARIVLWGTLAGSLLPFVLRRLGLDPASASTPFVATVVDVTGLVIYFTVAKLVLRGTLL